MAGRQAHGVRPRELRHGGRRRARGAARPTGATGRASPPRSRRWSSRDDRHRRAHRRRAPPATDRGREPRHRRGHPHRPGRRRRRGRASSRRAAAPRSPRGRRSASRAAAASCGAPRSGSSTTRDRIVETIVSETGKTYEDAQLAEIGYAADAFGFWAKHAPEYLADEKVRSVEPVRGRPQAASSATGRSASSASSGRGTTRSRNSFGDCIPALAAGNAVDPQAVRGHAAHLAADGRVHARVRPARGRLPGRHRARARPARR